MQVAGAAIPTTYVSPTTLTAVIPASAFLVVTTLPVTVSDPAQNQLSAAINISVTAPPVSIQFGAPTTVTPTAQPTVTLVLTNPYPVVLTGTITLTFKPTGTGQDDPSIQFAGGGRTLVFQVPSNSTMTPTIQFQTGTVAGTITLTLQLVAGGVNVTPASVQAGDSGDAAGGAGDHLGQLRAERIVGAGVGGGLLEYPAGNDGELPLHRRERCGDRQPGCPDPGGWHLLDVVRIDGVTAVRIGVHVHPVLYGERWRADRVGNRDSGQFGRNIGNDNNAVTPLPPLLRKIFIIRGLALGVSG